jgi:4-oxalocrotonate tautomerase
MPIISVEMFEGRTIEQKREFVDVITRETCRILKTTPDSVDIVFSEIRKADWATGGKLWSEK